MDACGCWTTLFIAILAFSIFHSFCSADKAPNFSFVLPATSAPPIDHFDYIVVGGGTAGCSLAATLSNGATVLLLERGGSPYRNNNIENLGGSLFNIVDLSPTSPAQQFVSEDGVFNARARVLGGGTAINAGFYSRAQPEFIEKLGLDNGLVEQSYQWVEKKLVFQPAVQQFQNALRDGLVEAGVLPFNGFSLDHIRGTKFGGTIFDQNGKRHTAADLLEYADPKTTTVYLEAIVHKVLFSKEGSGKPRAYGVEFKDSKGFMHQALLQAGPKSDVILSAGALGSPQLLMLSGIGPASELKSHGIEVVLDQPQVGQGMADNPLNAIVVPSPSEEETSLVQAVGITGSGSYIEAASGSTSIGAIIRDLAKKAANTITSQGNQPSSSATAQDDILRPNGLVDSILNRSLNVGIIGEKINGPISSGYLRLKSLNPDDNPKVKFNYFDSPEDLQKCVEGMETLMKVIESDSFKKFRLPGVPIRALMTLVAALPVNLRPRHLDTAFSLERYCKDTVLTIYHYHGGSQVDKVVDKEFKVIGTEGLRVVDGSTFHETPGTNPQATIMMLGRYMGMKILAERKKG